MSFICSDMFGRYPPMWKVQLDELATIKCDHPAGVCYWKGLVPTYLLTAVTAVASENCQWSFLSATTLILEVRKLGW